MSNQLQIGTISNYYGGLWIKQEDGKFFWSIENYDDLHWVEIPESLFQALLSYENGLSSDQVKP